MAELFEDIRVVCNFGSDPLQVCFEPWGMLHTLRPGSLFRVVGRSAQAGRMDVADADDAVTVFAWPGATLQVFEGEALVDDFNIEFPDVPSDMSIQRFQELMFGGAGHRK